MHIGKNYSFVFKVTENVMLWIWHIFWVVGLVLNIFIFSLFLNSVKQVLLGLDSSSSFTVP